MNKQATKYEKYLEKVNSYQEPVIPKVKLDMRGALAYARSKGVRVSELSKEEKERFIERIGYSKGKSLGY